VEKGPFLTSTTAQLCNGLPIPVAAQSKAWVCSRLLAGIVGTSPARGINACLMLVLRRADHSSRRVSQSVVCLIGVPRNFFGRGSKLQLRTEGRENGDLGAVAP
jgi:hypothetical protein